MSKLRVLELFGGIGACSKALERLGINYEIADYVEIDKYAVKSYNAMHDTNFEPQDICEWNKDIEVDLIMHGSPCQDFSLAGKQAGGDKDSGTRSSLMYETIRIVEKLKPKYVIWENVKNLLSKKHRHNFDAYLETMEQLGYINYYQVLNAKDYGIPQNRERVFTISILGNENYEFPKGEECENKIQVVGNYMPSGYDASRIVDENGLAPTLDTMQGGWRQPCIEEKTVQRTPLKFLNRNQKNIKGDYAFCVDSCNTGGVKEIEKNRLRIRKLTPKECWRLMGFDDKDFEKAAKVNSNTQLYKQAGNSIVVNVLEAILKELLLNE